MHFSFSSLFLSINFLAQTFICSLLYAGPAAPPWIWPPYYKRVKVNIFSFGNSEIFSLLLSKNPEKLERIALLRGASTRKVFLATAEN